MGPETMVALGVLLDPFCGRPSQPCAKDDKSRRVSLPTTTTSSDALYWVVLFITFLTVSRFVQPDIVSKIPELGERHAQ